MSKKQNALNCISDLVSDLTYYDRKESDYLSEKELDSLVESGELTIDEMVDQFRKDLENVYNQIENK